MNITNITNTIARSVVWRLTVFIIACLAIGWVIGTWSRPSAADRVMVPASYIIEHDRCQQSLTAERTEHIATLTKLAACGTATTECMGMMVYYRDIAAESGLTITGVRP